MKAVGRSVLLGAVFSIFCQVRTTVVVDERARKKQITLIKNLNTYFHYYYYKNRVFTFLIINLILWPA